MDHGSFYHEDGFVLLDNPTEKVGRGRLRAAYSSVSGLIFRVQEWFSRCGNKGKSVRQHGGVIWFTGISGSGKSTLSRMVGAELAKRAIRVEILDGDFVRATLSRGLGFSKEDRNENIRRIGFVANLLARNGVRVLVAAVSPYRTIREEVRKVIESEGAEFIEVYVRCPLEVAERRDPKGLYKRARAGEIEGFTGVSDPYEEPILPEVVVDTDRESAEESAARVLAFLEARWGR